MLGLLAHGFHLLLVVFGLVGVAVLLFPKVQAAARSSRRTAFRPPANLSEHEQRVAELRAAVASGRLTTPEVVLRSRGREARDAATWRAVAVASSMAAAGVHAAVFPHHLQESYVVGISFLAMTLGQAAWACLVTIDAEQGPTARRGDRRQPRPGGALGGLAHFGTALRPGSRGGRGLGHRRGDLGAGPRGRVPPGTAAHACRTRARDGGPRTHGMGLGAAVGARAARPDPDRFPTLTG